MRERDESERDKEREIGGNRTGRKEEVTVKVGGSWARQRQRQQQRQKLQPPCSLT